METLWATAITLFLIMDPLGNVPIFLVVLEHVAEHRRRYIILRELIIALIVMLLFLFAGPAMLRTLGISPEAVAIAAARSWAMTTKTTANRCSCRSPSRYSPVLRCSRP